MKPLFTVIVVCLNPGEKLKTTLSSIDRQSCRNFEVLVKDGCSTDTSLQYAIEFANKWEKEQTASEKTGPALKIIEEKDAGIYDAMNQAVKEAQGALVYFLNCGDSFHSADVLEQLAEMAASGGRWILYGDIFERLTGQRVASNPQLDAFGCYRNVPCHQACFYSKELLLEHPFEISYRVRADYEQFLWCFFKGNTKLLYTGLLIADYEGGGYSETGNNKKISAAEHRVITGKYLTGSQRFWYRMILLVTLAPLRTAIAANPGTAGFYNKLKDRLYRGRM